MMSAFGVEHTVSKSFKKLQPKLEHAEYASIDRSPDPKTQTLEARFKENYAGWRNHAGLKGRRMGKNITRKISAGSLDQAQGDKEGAKAMVTAVGNITRRAGRVLP